MKLDIDIIIHLSEMLIIIPVIWKANRVVTRILDALESFPPHRHINGHIIYPKQYEPTEVGNMKGN